MVLSGPLIFAACGTPDSTGWNRKDAHRNCAAAIEAYPGSPAPPCAAMHMCANEATLTAGQKTKLLEMIHATEGCRDP